MRVLAVSNASAATLVVRVHWTYEFSGPEHHWDAGPEPGEGIQARYPDLFTTSVSDLDSTKLVMKYKSGGEAAGFPGASPLEIYKIADGATINAVVDEKGTKSKVSWFCGLKDYRNGDGDVVLAPFLTYKAAQDYAGAGTNDKLMPYYGAGDWSIPDQPVFYPYTQLTSHLHIGPPMPSRAARVRDTPDCLGDWELLKKEVDSCLPNA